jgi:hypothetical protein
MAFAYDVSMKSDAPKYRCPFTVDWVRNQADVEIHQLVLIEVPRQNMTKVVLDLGANTVSKEAIGVEEDDSSAS